jgi:hypothetical protein
MGELWTRNYTRYRLLGGRWGGDEIEIVAEIVLN